MSDFTNSTLNMANSTDLMSLNATDPKFVTEAYFEDITLQVLVSSNNKSNPNFKTKHLSDPIFQKLIKANVYTVVMLTFMIIFVGISLWRVEKSLEKHKKDVEKRGARLATRVRLLEQIHGKV